IGTTRFSRNKSSLIKGFFKMHFSRIVPSVPYTFLPAVAVLTRHCHNAVRMQLNLPSIPVDNQLVPEGIPNRTYKDSVVVKCFGSNPSIPVEGLPFTEPPVVEKTPGFNAFSLVRIIKEDSVSLVSSVGSFDTESAASVVFPEGPVPSSQ